MRLSRYRREVASLVVSPSKPQSTRVTQARLLMQLVFPSSYPRCTYPSTVSSSTHPHPSLSLDHPCLPSPLPRRLSCPQSA